MGMVVPLCLTTETSSGCKVLSLSRRADEEIWYHVGGDIFSFGILTVVSY
jgi:hypothetical protein